MTTTHNGKRSTRRGSRFRLAHIRPRRNRRGVRPTSSFLFRLTHLLQDHRNPTVRRIHRRGSLSQSLVCESAHLGRLIFSNSVHLHQSSRRISPIRRKFPVTIIAPVGIRFRALVPLNPPRVRNFP